MHAKSSEADQSAVLPTHEELAEKSHQLAEKPPPHCRPLRRTHTDPTDLLWVFRRRATRLAQEGNNNLGIPRRKFGVSALFHPPIDGTYGEIPESTSEGVNEKSIKCDEPKRKISCPVYRVGQRESAVTAHTKHRRASVAAPRRMGRRGSEVGKLS
ncbi:hypothetical protein P5673_008515 [Acropora cervicornis]|uniref:Uncharacterized protein n=1 Tax=Acropora cervicornis TaxID=6130 RepID=A0AAD9VB73_ACRCE|nr:hypothetical protein P5673_008515 [Acropora cervicornis]